MHKFVNIPVDLRIQRATFEEFKEFYFHDAYYQQHYKQTEQNILPEFRTYKEACTR